MKKQERQHRLALTLLFTALVLCFMLVTLIVVGFVIYVLIRFEILTGPDNTVPSAARVIIIFGLAALVIGAGMTFVFGKIPMKPINRIINQMNRLAAGDYRARIDFGRFWGKHSTVAEFTDSFNRMATELESTEMLRSDFINNFSHEFKTPIVSITGFAKLLKRGNLSEQERTEYLGIIEEESVRLSQMATNVLNLTRIENQTILTDVTTFNLSEQLRDSVLLLVEKWEKKNLDIGIDMKEHNIEANEELLKQVWINLLDNAVKFSPDYGDIELKIEEMEQTLRVSVANYGGDIPPEFHKRIFNKFYQADESHASEGNGIGLAIVKSVVGLHGGEVGVESGSGKTTFTVELPKLQRV
ncbi:MAG: HAMP domain-containing histidine kinase [Ruminococcaceae bacterium]|nr:HAMP domain-containing histidine kinase [Oscillospiraceae bacterium]